jgi:hypothetical protein
MLAADHLGVENRRFEAALTVERDMAVRRMSQTACDAKLSLLVRFSRSSRA